MAAFECWIYPNLPSNINEVLLQDEKKLVVVGVIGKSAFPDCNKMTGFDLFDVHPSLLGHKCREGQISFYYSKSEPILFVHFETTYDEYCMRQEMFKQMDSNEPGRNLVFNKNIRNRFARMFLFALQVCNIVIFVELSVTFDSSLLSLLKSLKIIREKYVLKFLPKLLKNPSTNTYLSKYARIYSPRLLFYFENYPDGYDKSEEAVSKLESEIDENIYKMFRNEQIVPNKSGISFFSLPTKKRFVYYNRDDKLREDPLLKSLNELQLLFERNNIKDDNMNWLDELRPCGGFGKPLVQNTDIKMEVDEKKDNFMIFLKDHVNEILQNSVEDSASKYKSKTGGNTAVPNMRAWYETFKLFHKTFIEDPDNPDFEPTDPSYKAYLENFDKLMDIDEGFYARCCNIGVKKACNLYNNPVLSHYGKSFHKTLVDEALAVYMAYARGPSISMNEEKLREIYEQHWPSEKQQADVANSRNTGCPTTKPNSKENSLDSGEQAFTSSCNCGRTQAGREDPYTIRQENYEFNRVLPDSCVFCVKGRKSDLPS